MSEQSMLESDLSLSDPKHLNFVREQRQDFAYDPSRGFDDPLIIQGTNRVFEQSRSLHVLKPSETGFDDLVGQLREVDTHLDLIRLNSLSMMRLDRVTAEYITFTIEGLDRAFYIDTPFGRPNSLAFKQFAKLLAIPYSFAKKNPTYLNKINFGHWLRAKGVGSDAPTVDLIFNKRSSELTFVESDSTGNSVNGLITLTAHRLISMLPVKKRQRHVRELGSESGTSPLVSERLPLFSDILSNARAQIQRVFPQIETKLQSYSVGYESANKGLHFARLTFDSPATNFSLDGEKYELGLNIHTDFGGLTRDFGNVNYNWILFRQICENGLVAQISSEQREVFQHKYLQDALSSIGLEFGAVYDGEDGDRYIECKRGAETKFAAIFSPNGLSIPVLQANANLENTLFTDGLRFFLESKALFKDRLKELQTEFEKVGDERFVEVVTSLQKSMKLKSPELIKVFILEYLAGEVSGIQCIKSPLDVVNFLTFLGRAYDAAILYDIETKAMTFAIAMAAAFSNQSASATTNLASQYRSQINQRLLVS